MEGVFNVDHVPDRRGSQKGVSPVAANLSADVRKVGYDVGSECVDVGEDLGWEFVDGRERVSHRSDGADSFGQALLDANDLRSRVSRFSFSWGDHRGVPGRTSERERLEYAL